MFEQKVSININIPLRTYKKIKVLCAMENQSMTSRITNLINNDIEEYQEEKQIRL